MAEQLFQIGIKGLARDAEGKILMVHIPAKGNRPGYWDLPGGRMNPGETFLETLERELYEEIGVSYLKESSPWHVATTLTNITIPVGDKKYPLVLVVYEVIIAADAEIIIDVTSGEDDYRWLAPAEAADKMAHKFSTDFCDIVRAL